MSLLLFVVCSFRHFLKLVFYVMSCYFSGACRDLLLRLIKAHQEFCSRRRTFDEVAELPDLQGRGGKMVMVARGMEDE